MSINIPESMPVPIPPAVRVIDSSKVKDFITCERKFFFRHILGWTSADPNLHLVFGSAWHRGLEQLLVGGYSDASVAKAYDLFLEEYRSEFPPETDDEMFPKNPAMALLGYTSYAAEYGRRDNFEVIYTEVSGTVPINEAGRQIHFRLDSIVHDDEFGFYSQEHKTSGMMASNWQYLWDLDLSIGTYTHVLHCLYDIEDIGGVQVNGTFFRKGRARAGDIAFRRTRVRKSAEAMLAWVWELNHRVDMIEYNLAGLSECTADDTSMQAFPKRPTSCMSYGRMCPYHTFCTIWANPLSRCDRVPVGMKKEFWNPQEYETKATNVLHIGADTTKKGGEE